MTYSEKIDALTEVDMKELSSWECDFISDMVILLEEDEGSTLTENQKEKIDELYEKHVEGE